VKGARTIGIGLVIDLLMTSAIAWAGLRWIAGYDIRGPFLLMSPLYAFAIFFMIAGRRVFRDHPIEGEAKSVDIDLIEATAQEFDLGPVSVIQQRYGNDLRLVLTSSSGDESSLPTHWDKMSFDAKRFAVVMHLKDSKKSFMGQYAKNWPSQIWKTAAMMVAGLNLWLILACHAAGAVWFAYTVFVQRARLLTDADIKTLRVMRDLNAAIAYATADPANSSLNILPEQRIAALRKEANKLGIA